MTDAPRGTLTEPDRPLERPAPRRERDTDVRRVRWTTALGVGVLAFLLWLVLDAPTLQHNAKVSPVGARRTVSLDLLGPVAAFSRALQLSHVVSLSDGAIGRNGNRPGNGAALVTLGPSGHKAPTPAPVAGVRTGAHPVLLLPSYFRPTAATPLRVLIVGDSLGSDLGGALENDLANTGIVQVTLDAQIETGLSRPDYFNWPAELQTDLTAKSPQIVVIMVGANDAQDLPGPPDVPYGSPLWTNTYSQRVLTFMQEAAGAGAKVVWVGMPPMQNPGLSTDMSALDDVYRAEAAKAAGVTYVSSWSVLGTPKGQYAPYLTEGGQSVNVREPDGTHIAPGGAELLSQAVLAVMRTQLHVVFP